MAEEKGRVSSPSSFPLSSQEQYFKGVDVCLGGKVERVGECINNC